MNIFFLFLAIYFGIVVVGRLIKGSEVFIFQILMLATGIVGFIATQFDL